MSVADKMIMSDETAKGLVNGMMVVFKVGGFWGRMGVYLMLYVPLTLVITIILAGGGENDVVRFLGLSPKFFATSFGGVSANYMFMFKKFFLYFVPTMIPFLLIELSIRSWRRKNGFSVYKNIEEELRQREVDIVVAREEKARGKLNTSSDGKDLDYWFGMMEKGAITEAQYNAKRDALLNE